MNNIVSITEFRNNISDYINKVIYSNKTFLIKRGRSVVAKVSSYEENDAKENKRAKLLSLAGAWKNLNTEKLKSELEKLSERDKKELLKHDLLSPALNGIPKRVWDDTPGEPQRVTPGVVLSSE